MDQSSDPLYQFFDPKEAETPNILYKTLELSPPSSPEQIRKSYRRLALRYHPDKHSSKTSEEKETASKTFQKIGFAYAVLSDEKRKKVYDSSGKTDEKWMDVEEMGWEKYFEGLFERVDRTVLDDDKKKYQGSKEEKEDLMKAYEKFKGSFPSILDYIPHATTSDEDRFVILINEAIENGKLTETPKWKTTSTDKSAKEKRAKKAAKEAKKAEEAAKELGVWDEFYGSGKKGKRKADDNEKGGKKGKDEHEGDGGLQALILKRQEERSGGLDRLAEKYKKIEEEEKARRKAKGKKRKSDVDVPEPAEMTDAEFEALQAKMFGGKKSKK